MNPWIICPSPNPQAKLRLFCFPYAGGGAWIFRDWATQLPASIEVCAIELPGRSTRMREPAFTNLADLLQNSAQNSLLAALLPALDKPFALFGHSLGGLISFELARLLRREYHLTPVHLFISGRRAPQIPDLDPPIHNLPEHQFLQKLRELNGTPEEILQNRELMQVVLPMLRADFALIETYTYQPESPLTCPITVFGGLQDTVVSLKALEGWRQQTLAQFVLHLVPGNHFFLHTAQTQLLNSLRKLADDELEAT